MQSPGHPVYDRIAWAVMLVLLGAVLAAFRIPGLAWDDHFQSHYGDLILAYIESGFSDDRVFTYANLGLYGGLFDAIAQFAVRFSPFSALDTRHLLSALAGLAGLIGAWRFARYLGGARAGLLALLLLAVTPSFAGHAFINVKDIPFAAAYVWALYFATRTAVAFPEIPVHVAVLAGVAAGAAMGVRIGGVLLLGYMALLLTQHYVWVRARETLRGWVSELASAAGAILMVLLPAFVLTFVLWPASWANPLLMAFVALVETTRFSIVIDVLLDGVYYPSDGLPWHYLFTYFALKLPEILLLAAGAGLPLTLMLWWRALKASDRPLGFGLSVIYMGILIPVGYALAAGSSHYDGVRHFLFILPPLAIIGALGLATLWAWLEERNPASLGLIAAFVAFGLAMGAVRVVQLFPYTYASFNAFAGGLRGAEGRFETDYWALGYKDAAKMLTRHMGMGEKPYTVYVCGPQPSAAPFLDARARIVDDIEEADFFICLPRWGYDDAVQAPVVGEILAGGARMAVIKDLRSGFDIVGAKPKTLSLKGQN